MYTRKKKITAKPDRVSLDGTWRVGVRSASIWRAFFINIITVDKPGIPSFNTDNWWSWRRRRKKRGNREEYEGDLPVRCKGKTPPPRGYGAPSLGSSRQWAGGGGCWCWRSATQQVREPVPAYPASAPYINLAISRNFQPTFPRHLKESLKRPSPM